MLTWRALHSTGLDILAGAPPEVSSACVNHQSTHLLGDSVFCLGFLLWDMVRVREICLIDLHLLRIKLIGGRGLSCLKGS